MNLISKRHLLASLVCLTLISSLLVGAGCGTGKPTVISFTGKGSKSAQDMKTTIDKLKKKYDGKVVFEVYDYNDPKNKGLLSKYHVTMNPTTLILNAQGQIKEQFIGTAQEEMLTMSIESFLPQKNKKTTSMPGASTVPGMPQPVAPQPYSSSIPGTTGARNRGHQMPRLRKRVRPAYVLITVFTAMIVVGLAWGAFGQVLTNAAVICLDCIGII